MKTNDDDVKKTVSICICQTKIDNDNDTDNRIINNHMKINDDVHDNSKLKCCPVKWTFQSRNSRRNNFRVKSRKWIYAALEPRMEI